jgi:elongation factor P
MEEKSMIYASDFRKGNTFELNGEPHVILDFQHVKPGKGAAFVRTKYKNILSGATREEAFNPNDKFPKAHIDTKMMQYLYTDGELYYFMDQESFDQVPLMADQVEDAMLYLRENDIATIKFYKNNAFLVEAPNFVNLKVIETEPGVKGDTATNVTKAATVETGAVIQVPIFIEEGETILIDTRTGEYLSRSK